MRMPILAAAGVAAATVMLTALSWQVQRDRSQDDFDFRAREFTANIGVRMKSYEQVLRGSAALFAASNFVTRDDWRAYAQSLRLAEGYPGIQGIGYSVRIAPSDLADHVAAVRAEGYPGYAVHPPGERDEYHAIVFIEPFDWRNQRAFGYDMFSEPVRRAAMERARDRGNAALSGAVKLVQETDENVQAGFNLYLPVYRPGAATDTVDQRRAALLGFVYSPFRMNDLLHGILGDEPRLMSLQVYDGADRDELMYSNRGPAEELHFRRSTELEIAGRTWVLDFAAPVGFGNRADQRRPWLILVAGLLVSLLTFVAVWALVQRRRGGEAFSQVVASALDAIIMIDAEDRILEFNPAAEVMFGYTRDEACGQRLAELLVPPQLRERHLVGLRAFVAAGKGTLRGRSLETEALRRDGSTFPVEIAITRVGDSRPPRFSGFVRDISERRNRQQELLRLNAELESRVAERTRELEAFAYSVSHDLRGPLRAIDGFSGELQRQYGPQLDDGARHFLDRIRAGASRMAHLIDDLLGLSRVAQKPLERAPVDLSALAATVIAQLRTEEPGRDVAVEIEPTPPVSGDARLLQVVLDNLLRNAWKFSSKREGARITFAARMDEHGETVYSVRDNGAGFNDAYADNLFVPFQRLHTDSEFPGTGIGLATVQRVVQRHGGRIWATGVEGEGATFWFTLGGDDG